ncbi:MAG: hypothetical protein K1T65_01670, partial [Candidatus Aramenus sp.]|nr:hypothetical protein [Candidatus Aramenus sp.]
MAERVIESLLSEGVTKALCTSTDYAKVRDTATCTAQKVKEVLGSDISYEVFPAVAVSEEVSRDIKNVFQAMRHGIIIRSKEGNYYYIGGKSRYWESTRFHAYRGLTDFVFNAEGEAFEAIRNAPSNIIVLQVRVSNLSKAWVQPGLPEGCLAPVIGWIMDAFEGGVGAGVIMNYLPYFLEQPMDNLEVPGAYIYES